MSKIPMLEKFAVQSLVEHDGELIFSKEKFAELIVRECARIAYRCSPADCYSGNEFIHAGDKIRQHFGVEE